MGDQIWIWTGVDSFVTALSPILGPFENVKADVARFSCPCDARKLLQAVLEHLDVDSSAHCQTRTMGPDHYTQ